VPTRRDGVSQQGPWSNLFRVSNEAAKRPRCLCPSQFQCAAINPIPKSRIPFETVNALMHLKDDQDGARMLPYKTAFRPSTSR
jgi:hypothetical protein